MLATPSPSPTADTPEVLELSGASTESAALVSPSAPHQTILGWLFSPVVMLFSLDFTGLRELGKRFVASQPREGKLWLLAAGLMILVGLLKGINLLVLMAYLLIGLWIVNGWYAQRSLQRLQAERVPGEPIFAGIPTDHQVIVSCEKGSPLRGWTLEDGGEGFGLVWLVLYLRAGQVLRLRRELTIAQRGRHRVEPLRASSRYPFGLFCATIELAPPEELIVLPRLGTLQLEHFKQWLLHAVRGDGRLRRRVRQSCAQEADIHGLRDYRTGDSPRWIHWRSSARRGHLLVREFEDNSPPNLILAVEPFLPPTPTDAQKQRLEQVISLAATICREWCRELGGRLILVLARPESVILEGATNSEHALHCLEALALEPGTNSEPTTAWIETLGRSPLAMPILVLSSRDGSAFAAAIGNEIGRAIASVDVDQPMGWYEPPLGV